MMDYLVVTTEVEGGFQWFLAYKDERMCFSPVYKTATKCLVEALFFGTVFGVEVVQSEPPKKSRHLRLL